MARILLIDDDEALRAMLRRFLEKAGYEVIEASDGRRGVAAYRENPTDLVITDIFMPEGDGALTIKQLTRDFPDVKIFAMSGGGSIVGPEVSLRVAERAGAQRTFMKPFSSTEMLRIVRELLKE